MSAGSFISTLRRSRFWVLECVVLASVFAAAILAVHEFNAARHISIDRPLMVSELALLEVITIGGFAFFAWRRIQEKELEIAKRIRSEQQARRLAHLDPLTRIANRRKFYKLLNAAASSPPAEGVHALLLFDLNGFKQVNDQFGHRAGDLLLATVARRLSATTRQGETIARLGGDEFAVVARNLSGPSGATELAGRIMKCLAEPMPIGSAKRHIGLGIGIALMTQEKVKSEELLRRADVALYRAKATKRSAAAIYRSETVRDENGFVEPGDRVELLFDYGAEESDAQPEPARMENPPRLRLVC